MHTQWHNIITYYISATDTTCVQLKLRHSCMWSRTPKLMVLEHALTHWSCRELALCVLLTCTSTHLTILCGIQYENTQHTLKTIILFESNSSQCYTSYQNVKLNSNQSTLFIQIFSEVLSRCDHTYLTLLATYYSPVLKLIYSVFEWLPTGFRNRLRLYTSLDQIHHSVRLFSHHKRQTQTRQN